jgi:prepilin-type N-terminal cleavage/methylation domain-containing protein
MTTSETGEPRGFTLIEILLVVALIGLIGWIFISGSTALLADKGASQDDQFWTACGAARKEALEERLNVVMSYDARGRNFVLSDGASVKTLPVKGPEDLTIDFHPVGSDSSSSVLIGGTLVETEALAAVTFYSDGTCTPFRVQLRVNNAAHLLSVDPWTCAPILTHADATQ